MSFFFLMKLMASLVQLHTAAGTSGALPSASHDVLFPSFCALFPFHFLCNKREVTKVEQRKLVLIFAYEAREWAHHWEGMAAAFIRKAFLGKTMIIRDTNFLKPSQVRLVRSLWHCIRLQRKLYATADCSHGQFAFLLGWIYVSYVSKIEIMWTLIQPEEWLSMSFLMSE